MDYFSAVLTADALISEVVAGPFAFKNKIKPSSVKSLWEKLSLWICDVLKSQKVRQRGTRGRGHSGPQLNACFYDRASSCPTWEASELVR